MPTAQDFADAPLYRLLDAAGNMSDTFRAVRTDDGMSLSDGKVIGRETFRRTGIRCDESGDPVIPVEAPLATQALALRHAKGAGSDGLEGHLADLKAIRSTLGPAETSAEPFDLHLHDVLSSGLKDTALPQHALDQQAVEKAAARLVEGPGDDGFAVDVFEMNPVDVETPDLVLARIQQDTGISADRWHNVSDYPTYMMESIRAAAREMLRPILGNTAVLEDLRRLEISKGEVERFNAVRRWAKSSGDDRTLPPFKHKSMPGYVTSEATLADVNGVTMLIFSDFKAHYAYAWQSDPDVAPKLKEDVEPTGPRF